MAKSRIPKSFFVRRAFSQIDRPDDADADRVLVLAQTIAAQMGVTKRFVPSDVHPMKTVMRRKFGRDYTAADILQWEKEVIADGNSNPWRYLINGHHSNGNGKAVAAEPPAAFTANALLAAKSLLSECGSGVAARSALELIEGLTK